MDFQHLQYFHALQLFHQPAIHHQAAHDTQWCNGNCTPIQQEHVGLRHCKVFFEILIKHDRLTVQLIVTCALPAVNVAYPHLVHPCTAVNGNLSGIFSHLSKHPRCFCLSTTGEESRNDSYESVLLPIDIFFTKCEKRVSIMIGICYNHKLF